MRQRSDVTVATIAFSIVLRANPVGRVIPDTLVIIRVNLRTDRCDQPPLASRERGRTRVSGNVDATAQCWATAQRVGAKIAALPIAARESAFDGTESCLREAGSELGVAGEQLDRIVDLQMWAIRKIVDDSDANHRPASADVVAVFDSDPPPPYAGLIADR
jgi:hypothetical protein